MQSRPGRCLDRNPRPVPCGRDRHVALVTDDLEGGRHRRTDRENRLLTRWPTGGMRGGSGRFAGLDHARSSERATLGWFRSLVTPSSSSTSAAAGDRQSAHRAVKTSTMVGASYARLRGPTLTCGRMCRTRSPTSALGAAGSTGTLTDSMSDRAASVWKQPDRGASVVPRSRCRRDGLRVTAGRDEVVASGHGRSLLVRRALPADVCRDGVKARWTAAGNHARSIRSVQLFLAGLERPQDLGGRLLDVIAGRLDSGDRPVTTAGPARDVPE